MTATTGLKTTLISLILISVVADTLLLPFYPHFFASAFGVEDPQHIGLYLAAICLTVMCAFPLWSRLVSRIHELHLLVLTQLAAAGCALLSYLSSSLVEFWVWSLLMMVFKASYLLIYPFVMRLEKEHTRLGMVGLISVLVHFGGIGGAVLGGMMLELFNPAAIFLLMGATDLFQVLLCALVIITLKVPFKPVVTEDATEQEAPRRALPGYVLQLGVLSLLFYFCIFLIRPFFTRYWESFHGADSTLVTSLAFAIPAFVALGVLVYNHLRAPKANHQSFISWGMLCILAGLFLQASEQSLIVVLGRILFGFGFFQASVHLEALLFKCSTPDYFARDFSSIHFFQSTGALLAYFAAGSLVDQFSLSMPFYAAALIGGLTLALFLILFRLPTLRPAHTPARAS